MALGRAAADTAAGIAAYEAGAFTEAKTLLAPEAESGNPRAQFYLGLLHAEGPMPMRDLQAANAWFAKAADGGYAEAQFQLGMRYSVGLGSELNLVEAYKWLRISERGLGTGAPEAFMQTFIGKMSAEEIAAGEEAAAAWLTAHADTSPELLDEPPAQTTPTVDAILALGEAYDCADLHAKKIGEEAFRVAGVLRSDAEVKAFADELTAAFGQASIETELDAIGDPNCAVAALVGRHRPNDPVLKLATGEDSIAAGDLVVVEIAASDVSRYLYVDYFQLDGTVIHILPEAVGGPSRIEPGTQLRLGDGTTSGFVWRSAPPFGRELLVVLMSDPPLFDAPRPFEEPVDDYLRQLRTRTGAIDADKLIADYVTITTIPNQP